MQGGLELIGHFPDPHPDELLYSVCARFSDHVGYQRPQLVMLDLFGTENAIAAVTFPSHLDYLIEHLPPGSTYTWKYLIEEHTLLPFYSVFLPPERVRLIQIDIRGALGLTAHMHAGISASRIPLPRRLRYCSLCIVEDRKQFGESYWHRIHQLSGVEVCPIHYTYLQDSSVHAGNTKNKHNFVSAESALHMHMHKMDLFEQSVCHDEVSSNIAQDAYWLHREHPLPQDPMALKDRYLKRMIELDLATPSGMVRISLLMQKFLNYYSPKRLEHLHCNFVEGSNENWLSRLARHKYPCSAHPLYHILLIRFLGYDIESFFALPTDYKPFGLGPWPCLNKVSDHYGQYRIEKCSVIYDPNIVGRPKGIFSCTCGFEYSRIGPDSAVEDHFKLHKVRSFGHLWEAELKRLWEDESVSLGNMARQLGVARETVKNHADKLGFTSSLRFANKTVRTTQELVSCPDIIPSFKSQKAETYRVEWLNIMKENPQDGIQELRHKAPAAFIWLSRHESEWLKTHRPLSRRGTRSRVSNIDWGKRDLVTAEKVKASAIRIKNTPGRPIQVTRSAIAKDMDCVAWLHRFLDKLPLTAKALTEVVESREAFAVRRVQWAESLYLQERSNVKRWQLIHRAGVTWISEAKDVKDAIEVALATINSPNGINDYHIEQTEPVLIS